MILYEFELKNLLWTHGKRPDQPLRQAYSQSVSQAGRQADRQTDKNCIPPQSQRSTTDQSEVNIDACSSAPIATKYGDAFGLAHRLKAWNRGFLTPVQLDTLQDDDKLTNHFKVCFGSFKNLTSLIR